MKRKCVRALALGVALVLTQRANADAVRFGPDLTTAGWTTVRFPGIPSASFKPGNKHTLEVSTDASAGLLWRAMQRDDARAGKARWSWQVEEGVPPTDLTRRGADDRALAVYFIFGGKVDLTKAPLALLASPSVTTLVYVFGSDRARGSVLPSPHMGSRGKFIVLQRADATRRRWFDEVVDLTGDYTRVFGSDTPQLLAVAISSDSDDTRGRNRARMRDLVVGD